MPHTAMRASPSILRAGSRLCESCRSQRQQQLSRCISTSSAAAAISPTHMSSRPENRSFPSRGSTITASSPCEVRQQRQHRRLFSGSRQPRDDEAGTDSTHSGKHPSSPPRSHYDLFPETLASGPPPAGPFHIDVRALRREFLRLQAKAHPDLHPPAMKHRAEATSALINEAFRTLADPLQRAQYLIRERCGVDLANDERMKTEDPQLLMEVLEAREVIEEAEDEGELEPLRRENEDRIARSEEVLGRAFAEIEGEGTEGGPGLERAKEECVRLRYWTNIRESINNWEKGKPIVLQH